MPSGLRSLVKKPTKSDKKERAGSKLASLFGKLEVRAKSLETTPTGNVGVNLSSLSPADKSQESSSRRSEGEASSRREKKKKSRKSDAKHTKKEETWVESDSDVDDGQRDESLDELEVKCNSVDLPFSQFSQLSQLSATSEILIPASYPAGSLLISEETQFEISLEAAISKGDSQKASKMSFGGRKIHKLVRSNSEQFSAEEALQRSYSIQSQQIAPVLFEESQSQNTQRSSTVARPKALESSTMTETLMGMLSKRAVTASAEIENETSSPKRRKTTA